MIEEAGQLFYAYYLITKTIMNYKLCNTADEKQTITL